MNTQKPTYILALDMGTTGNRALLLDANASIVASSYRELTQHYPQTGWVEHDAQEIWSDTQNVIKEVFSKATISAAQVAAIGIAVQRETSVIWERKSGKPLHPAIVWQDRRTAGFCDELKERGKASQIYEHTGLVIDAYFSATKIKWLLDFVASHHAELTVDDICVGTIDSWILWNLTGGKVHACDHSNASRTMLCNLETLVWDNEMCGLFDIPEKILPTIQPSMSDYGVTDASIIGAEIPITALLGDQQSSLFAHGCSAAGSMKCTYGTGAFLMAQTASSIPRSKNQLLSTVAWTAGQSKNYALEGSMFTAGACIQWLRDGAEIIESVEEVEASVQSVTTSDDVYFIPALSGLGAPHWDMDARGAFLGLTRGTKKAHLIRSVCEAIAHQVAEVVGTMESDTGHRMDIIKVDGGVCHSDFLMQYQADVLGIPVERPEILDVTAIGAAYAAGLQSGFWKSYDDLISTRKIDRVFEPGDNKVYASQQYSEWREQVQRILSRS